MRASLVKGRFDQPAHRFLDRFGASVGFDRRLWSQDILGSIAHAEMLGRQGVLRAAEVRRLCAGLREIARAIAEGRFAWDEKLEDVHMNIESRLIEALGETGRRLHTGRSRNDQVATDFRLWLREAIDRAMEGLLALRGELLAFADRHRDLVLPGYTHLQRAQPIRLAHWAHAYQCMLERDFERAAQARRRINQLPLGAAALAGTSYPIDRAWVADRLGFEGVIANSLDAVSDRDFALDFLAAAAATGLHLSRLCEEIVLWTGQEFAFAELDDALCTGSSIMPQKKNPDLAELIRGKSGRLVGAWTALAVVMKSLPLAYNKDMQEDKEPVFDAADTWIGSLEGARLLVANLRPRPEAMRRACETGFLTATDLADHLVGKGVPFRDAHALVGRAVAHAARHGLTLGEIDLPTYRRWSAAFGPDLYRALDVERSVESRRSPGGTAAAPVRRALTAAARRLDRDRRRLERMPRATLEF